MELKQGRPQEKRIAKEERVYDLLEKLHIDYQRIDHEKADTMEKSQSNLLYAIDTNRKSVSGVDEDEEGSDMIVFQNMLFNQYKMLNVLNEVLDKLINETGV